MGTAYGHRTCAARLLGACQAIRAARPRGALLKAQVQDAVGLVDDEHLQARRVEADRLVEVLQQPARRAHEQAHPRDPLRLLVLVLAADDQARREVVLLADHTQQITKLHLDVAG